MTKDEQIASLTARCKAMAREADAEMARLTGLIFDEINKNKTLTARCKAAEKALKDIEFFTVDPSSKATARTALNGLARSPGGGK